MKPSSWFTSASFVTLFAATFVGSGQSARAESAVDAPVSGDTAKPALARARWHPKYVAEFELHGTFAAFESFGLGGLGGGARITLPIWDHALIRSIDDEISFSIGFDYVRYGNYKPDTFGKSFATNAYYVPVALQWNFWLGARVSFFVEPQLLYRFADYDSTCDNDACAKSSRVLPSGSLGLRFRIVDHVSGTLRLGWPMASLGASWL